MRDAWRGAGRFAFGVLAQVIQRGLFAVEREGTFEFVTYADSVFEWRKYLRKNGKMLSLMLLLRQGRKKC
jgi:hypothetical protein